MANAVKGEIALEVDDRTLVLQLDVNGLCDMEAVTGECADITVDRLKSGASLVSIRALIWAALQAKQPGEFDLRAAGDLVQAMGVAVALEAVTDTVKACFPVAEAAKAPAGPPKRPAGTGRSSGAAG